MTLVSDKVNRVVDTFNLIDEKFRFITLRNFHLIPDDSSIENDIDIMIEKEEYHNFAVFMKNLGFEVNFDIGHEYLYGARGHIHCVDRRLGVHFDVVDGLYYRSLNQRNLFVGGFSDLEGEMWKNLVKVDECYKYRPREEDFLTHLCCHCVFDKMVVNTKYKELIEETYNNVDRAEIGKLFSHSFYKASEKLINTIENKKTEDLLKEYVGFSDY